MKIRNRTHWRTDDLRRYLLACLRHDGLDPNDPWHVTIDYTRQSRGCSGMAYIDSRTFTVRVPRTELSEKIRRDFIAVTLHELAHCRGLTHADMVDFRALDLSEFDLPPIRLRAAAAPAPPVDKLQKARDAVTRLDGLLEAEERRHRANVKRLKTRLRKARASLRYYEAKAAPPPS